MTVIATALRHMLAAGMPHDAIVAAVSEMEAATPASVDPVAERRRAYDRERKRAAKGNSTGIPPESAEAAESAEQPLSRPPNEKISNPPTHTPEHETTRARKGHRLPDDWTPTALTGDAATAVNGWPPGAVERELARFRDWAASATGANARKSNWDAAWRNWLRRVHDDGTYRKSTVGGGKPTTLDAIQRAIELTGGPEGRRTDEPRTGDWGVGRLSDPMLALGHVER